MMTVVGELVGAAEIGRMFGVGPQRVQQLTARDDFPEPVGDLIMGRVWREADVRAWAAAKGRTIAEDEV